MRLPAWVHRWWDVANERRCSLVQKKRKGGITKAQERELGLLQAVWGAICEYISGPERREVLAKLEKLAKGLKK